MYSLKNTHNHKKSLVKFCKKKFQKKFPKKKFQKKLKKGYQDFHAPKQGGEGAYTDATVITHLYTCTGKEQARRQAQRQGDMEARRQRDIEMERSNTFRCLFVWVVWSLSLVGSLWFGSLWFGLVRFGCQIDWFRFLTSHKKIF